MKTHSIILTLMLAAILFIPLASAVVVTAEPIGTTLTSHSEEGVTIYSYDASEEGRGIQRVGINVPTETTVSYTITYGSGSSLSGTMHYYESQHAVIFPPTPPKQTSSISLGSVTSDYEYVGFQQFGRFYVSGYGRNETSKDVWQKGFLIYGSTAGVSTISNDYVFYPVSGDPVIYKIDISSTNPVDVVVFTAPRADVAEAIDKSFLDVLNEWVQIATGMATQIKDIAFAAFRWLKFFFVDNLGMTVALYIAGSLAIAARASRGNPIKVLKQFFRDQKNLFEFILSMWERLVNLVATFRGIFRI